MFKKCALFFVIITIFILEFIFIDFKAKESDNPKYSLDLKEIKTLDFDKNSIDDIENVGKNVIIIVGDSRMEFLYNRGKSINIPINFKFIARGGSKIDWLNNYALEKLENKLENKYDGYKYHVVFNLGVNDLDSDDSVYLIVKNYYDIYKNLSLKYDEVNFYLLSVNPVDDYLMREYIKKQKRSLYKVNKFNDYMISLLNSDTSNNITYCDSFNNIDFGTPDGLHYDKNTDQKIIDFLVNKCIKYE